MAKDVKPAPDFHAEYEPVIRKQLAETEPALADIDGETEHRLYELLDGTNTPDGRGLYARTRVASDGEERLRAYGTPEFKNWTPAHYQYLDHLNGDKKSLYEEYAGFIRQCYEMLSPNVDEPSLTQFVEENEAFLLDRKMFVRTSHDEVANIVRNHIRAESFRDDDNHLPDETEIDAIAEVIEHAVTGWLSEQTDGWLADDWFGVCIFTDMKDWRDKAEELALHTSLSDQQSVAWAVNEENFPTGDIAYITGKEQSTITHQIKDAAKKRFYAKQLIDRTTTPHMGLDFDPRAHEAEVEQRKWERDKSPTVWFYTCPKCGRDTGAYNGDEPPERGSDPKPDFAADDPPTFLAAAHPRRSHGPDGGTRGMLVECPECGHVAADGTFEDTWTEHHGRIPEPDHPEPDPAPY